MLADLLDRLAKRQASPRVLVVGDVMLDRYWSGAVERISPEAPVPVVRVEHRHERLGGAANVALNVNHLGGRATLLSVVGCDGDGERLCQLLAEQAIDARISRDGDLATTVKLRVMARHQQLLRLDFEQTPNHELLAAVTRNFAAALPAADLVLLSDYGKGGLAHIEQLIASAREAGKPVLVDPKGHDFTRYRHAHALTPNLQELTAVIGPWQSEAQLTAKVTELLRQLELTALLLTRSEAGMTLFTAAGEQHSVPALGREVYDVSGAGDTAIAAFAVALAAGGRGELAMEYANRASAVVVAKLGVASASVAEVAALQGDAGRC